MEFGASTFKFCFSGKKKLKNLMDWEWDLWGPPYELVAGDNNPCQQQETQCDFSFGYGYDAIEEDALNEKCCIQVLKILITKADTDIDMLERELVSLQSELAWIEDEEWSAMCSRALTAKINSLDAALNRLRSKDMDDAEFHSLIDMQPNETLHDILKSLLTNCTTKDDEQLKDVKDTIDLDLASNAESLAINIVDENKRFTSCCSEMITSNEVNEFFTTSLEHNAILNPTVEVQEKKTINSTSSESEDIADATGLFSNSDSSRSSSIVLDENNRSTNCYSEIITRESVRKPATALTNYGAIVNPPWKIQERTRDSQKAVKPASCGAKYASAHSFKVITVHSGERRMLSIYGPKCMREGGGKECGSTPKNERVIQKLSSKSADMRKTGVNMVKVQPANIGASYSSTDASEQVAGDLSEKKQLRESGSISLCKDVGKRGFTFRADVSPAVKTDSDNKFKAKDSISEAEQKLSDFAAEVACKRTSRGSKLAVTDHQMKRKKENSLRTVKGKGGGTTDRENLTSDLALLLDPEGKNAAKIQLEEGKPIMALKTAETATDRKTFKLNLLASGKGKAKPSIKPKVRIRKEVGLHKLTIVFSSSSIAEGEKKQGSGAHLASSNQSLDGNITITAGPPAKDEGHAAVPEDSGCSASQPRKKRKTCADCPVTIVVCSDSTVQMEFTNSLGETTEWGSKDEVSISQSCSNSDSCSEAAISLSSALIKLKTMKMDDLRNIAKHLKLPKYCKLQKHLLVELLAKHITVVKPANLLGGGLTAATCDEGPRTF
ncbi:hypothetical protein Tsubulata_020487 [Turnera subulata]|uniref:Rho termination factor N-terminal domain-containing protein n=1 Tax=Turnera subulata TaxID=218843 RepID=A0A9Q0F450_9ROSI|nr:hypothetical protein Tsubulata_020487 [Turnera subulata]